MTQATVDDVKAVVHDLIAVKGADYVPPATGMYVHDDDTCCIVADVLDYTQQVAIEEMKAWDDRIESGFVEIVEQSSVRSVSENYTSDAIEFLGSLQFQQVIGQMLEHALITAVARHESKLHTLEA